MNPGKLRINQLMREGWTWYQDYLDALDAYDIDRYFSYLADNVSIQFSNDDPLTGRDVASAGLKQFWGSITHRGYTLLHEPLNINGSDDTFVLEALHQCDAPGSPRVTIRAAAFTDRGDDGKVTSVQIYKDASPLFAPKS